MKEFLFVCGQKTLRLKGSDTTAFFNCFLTGMDNFMCFVFPSIGSNDNSVIKDPVFLYIFSLQAYL